MIVWGTCKFDEDSFPGYPAPEETDEVIWSEYTKKRPEYIQKLINTAEWRAMQLAPLDFTKQSTKKQFEAFLA